VTSPTAAFTARGQPLTRYGIYKIVRRPAASLDDPRTGRRVSPHIFRHTAAVHLLEAGVEVNVIRGWLGTPTSPPPTATPRSTPRPSRRRS
jgi:site-specific recombinase XerD